MPSGFCPFHRQPNPVKMFKWDTSKYGKCCNARPDPKHARTLSRNCQSTVVLLRSFSVSSLAARRGCILLPNNPSTHDQLFPDSYRAAECSPSLFRLCERILSLSNRSTSSTARFFRPIRRKRRKFRVQPPHLLRQSPLQDHSPKILPLRCPALRRNHLSVHIIPPRVLKLLDRELFGLVFGDHDVPNLVEVLLVNFSVGFEFALHPGEVRMGVIISGVFQGGRSK